LIRLLYAVISSDPQLLLTVMAVSFLPVPFSFHYQQLAEDNDAEESSTIQSVSILSNAELPNWP
jgi:hypothetical protein